MSANHVWLVGATHEAFGQEGVREYVGSERGARIAAGKIARRGGHGWRPYVSEQDSLTGSGHRYAVEAS